MKLTEELLRTDLAMLNHGGPEAVSLFLEISRRLHAVGATEALRDWIVVAAPQLPEKERGEVIVLLMTGYFRLTGRTLQPDSCSIH